MRYTVIALVVFIVYLISSCGGSNHLDINGEDEAIVLAENMIIELGGRKNWEKLKSIYIRTTSIDNRGQPYVFEEWINLDEPKFMNHRFKDEIHYYQIVDKNDGWSVQNSKVVLMMPQTITDYLDWFDNFLMCNIKQLALGGETVEVKLHDDHAFDMFINNKFISRFQLNDNNLPAKYFTAGNQNEFNIININEWGEYKGFKYPLEVTVEGVMAQYKTDYWDIGMMDAESSFNITFDPYKIAKNFE
jgi:hypothetical protein